MVIRGQIHEVLPEGIKIVSKSETVTLGCDLLPDNFREAFCVGDRVFAEIDNHYASASGTAAFLEGKSSCCREGKNIRRERIVTDKFTPLCDLSCKKYSTVCAVLLRVQPPIKSKGDDYLFTLSLADETAMINLKIFIPELIETKRMLEISGCERLEEIMNKPFAELYRPGDIFIIHNIKHSGRTETAISHKRCKLRRIGNAREPPSTSKAASPTKGLLRKESLIKEYFSSLYCKMSDVTKMQRLLLRVEGIKMGIYFDLVAKVVCVEAGSPATLCVTDYTSNQKVASSRRGKYNMNMLLYIKAYGRHSEAAKSILVGKVYTFCNLKMRSMEKSMMANLSEGKYGGIYSADKEEENIIAERESKYLKCKDQEESDFSFGQECRKVRVFSQTEKYFINAMGKKERCTCGCEELHNKRIGDIEGTGFYILYSIVKQFDDFCCVICDGIDIIWAYIRLNTRDRDSVLEDGRWYWVLVLIKEASGKQNFLLDATDNELIALEWMKMLRPVKTLGS